MVDGLNGGQRVEDKALREWKAEEKKRKAEEKKRKAKKKKRRAKKKRKVEKRGGGSKKSAEHQHFPTKEEGGHTVNKAFSSTTLTGTHEATAQVFLSKLKGELGSLLQKTGGVLPGRRRSFAVDFKVAMPLDVDVETMERTLAAQLLHLFRNPVKEAQEAAPVTPDEEDGEEATTTARQQAAGPVTPEATTTAQQQAAAPVTPVEEDGEEATTTGRQQAAAPVTPEEEDGKEATTTGRQQAAAPVTPEEEDGKEATTTGRQQAATPEEEIESPEGEEASEELAQEEESGLEEAAAEPLEEVDTAEPLEEVDTAGGNVGPSVSSSCARLNPLEDVDP
ncbi:uncharacterized protein DDB_G0286299-like [Penaeus vannamei]|uniref:uncharacterized protein DDB_G0286299-like n=1 Tax=Penaeus vannamei TaxID=6689 RepID=UPI00387FAAB5